MHPRKYSSMFPNIDYRNCQNDWQKTEGSQSQTNGVLHA